MNLDQSQEQQLWQEHSAFMEAGDVEGAFYHANFVKQLGFDIAAEAMLEELKKTTVTSEPSLD